MIKNIKDQNPVKNKRTLIHRASETCKELKSNITTNTIPNVSPIPPRYDISVKIETNFMNNHPKDMPEQIIKMQFHMLENTTYKDKHKIFTDGSKTKEPNSLSSNIYPKYKHYNNLEIIKIHKYKRSRIICNKPRSSIRPK